MSAIDGSVTALAMKHFNPATRRCDWEAVSRGAGMPVAECVSHFNTRYSSIEKTSRPTSDDWSEQDLAALRRCTETYFSNLTFSDWLLVGIYMNTDVADCMHAHLLLKEFQMSDELFAHVWRCRESGLLWETIHDGIPDVCTVDMLREEYLRFKELQDARGIVWTREEDEQLIWLLGMCKNERSWLARIDKHIGRSPEACTRRVYVLAALAKVNASAFDVLTVPKSKQHTRR
ncbi:hypothetical protein GQ54DRAFT_195801 [Martensiomyces pterosporus]|nr:hypothetical protein GQ54DRAFT_195801 [Martensiomyces pterosporus]